MSATLSEAKPTISVRKIAFLAVVVVFALMHFFLSPLAFAVLGWFLEEGTVSHKVHEVSFGFIFVLSVVGLLAQLRKPQDKIAAMYQVVLPLWLTIGALVVMVHVPDPVAWVFLAVSALLLFLHPARHRVWRPGFSPSRALVALAVVAAVPLVGFAITEFRIGQQASTISKQVRERLPESSSYAEFQRELKRATASPEQLEAAQHLGHWPTMAAFALSIAALAVLASLKPPGWRLNAWSAGAAAGIYGIASLAFPTDASAAGLLWAVLALVWGLVFVIAAERDRKTPSSAEVAGEWDERTFTDEDGVREALPAV